MTAQITWNVAQMERHCSDGCVFTVHWTVTAVDGEHSVSAYGSIGLEPPEGVLIPYDDLTREIVVAWTKDKLGEQAASIEESLLKQLAEKQAPTTTVGLPWA